MRWEAVAPPPYRPITPDTVARTPFWRRMDRETREALELVSLVLPFRTNAYVLRNLIDWDRIPDDPIYRLTFPHPDMLNASDYARLRAVRDRGNGKVGELVRAIRARLNPNPQGQATHNVPTLDGRRLAGIQHKYHETVLFFPSSGQGCFAYCTYCFRWSQFVDGPSLQFAAPDSRDLAAYLRRTPEVTDVLVTGGDPLTMSAARLGSYLDPLLEADLDRVQNIRIGTKAPANWPGRFLAASDTDDLLRLLERVASRRHLAIMVHYAHPRELETPEAEEAIARLQSAGAVIRTQAPVLRHINDDPAVWARLWTRAVRLGVVPYYMFVARDTGASAYFELPLVRVNQIFRQAYSRVSGLARSVRGPVMSATPGKVRLLGIQRVEGARAFVLDYIQARDPALVRRPFFARYDPSATWFDDLEPLAGETFSVV